MRHGHEVPVRRRDVRGGGAAQAPGEPVSAAVVRAGVEIRVADRPDPRDAAACSPSAQEVCGRPREARVVRVPVVAELVERAIGSRRDPRVRGGRPDRKVVHLQRHEEIALVDGGHGREEVAHVLCKRRRRPLLRVQLVIRLDRDPGVVHDRTERTPAGGERAGRRMRRERFRPAREAPHRVGHIVARRERTHEGPAGVLRIGIAVRADDRRAVARDDDPAEASPPRHHHERLGVPRHAPREPGVRRKRRERVAVRSVDDDLGVLRERLDARELEDDVRPVVERDRRQRDARSGSERAVERVEGPFVDRSLGERSARRHEEDGKEDNSGFYATENLHFGSLGSVRSSRDIHISCRTHSG